MNKIIVLVLLVLMIGSCSMPYDGTSYIQYNGDSIEDQIERDEARYGTVQSIDGPIFQSSSWWYYIDYDTATVWYANDSGDDTPDYSIIFVYIY